MACPSNVPSGITTCYYISYSTGNDANAGTSEASPWKTAPGMVGYAGGHTPAVHDGYIFKGGDVWPSSTLPWNWPGTSGTFPSIYWGTDPTWNNGTVTAITPTSPGLGCTAITVTLSGGGGSNAAGTAQFLTSGPWAGNLQFITVTNAGSGYTSNPSVSFAGSTCTELPTAVADITRFVVDGSATVWTAANLASGAWMVNINNNGMEISGMELRGMNLSNTVTSNSTTYSMIRFSSNNGLWNNVYMHNACVAGFPQTGTTLPTNNVQIMGVNGGSASVATIQNSFFDNWECQQGGTLNPALYTGGTCGWLVDNNPNSVPGAALAGCNQSILVSGATTVKNTVIHDGRGLLYDSGTSQVQQYSNLNMWNGLFDAGTQHGDGLYMHGGGYFFNNYIKNINGGSNYGFEDCTNSSAFPSNCDQPNTVYMFNNVFWDNPDSGATQNFWNAAGEFGCATGVSGCTGNTTWASNPNFFFYNNTCYGSNAGTSGCIGAGQWFHAPSTIWASVQFTLQNNHAITTQANGHWYADTASAGGSITCPNPGGSLGCGTWNGNLYPNSSSTQSAIDAVNVVMTPSTATSQGYTFANGFTPTASSNSTVTFAGTNLTSLCSGVLVALCSDINGVARPATGNWDAGAYQFIGSSPLVSLSPTSLTFGNVINGTTSASQTITLTNTGGTGLVMTSVTLTGTNAAQFNIVSNTCTGTIAALGTCTTVISFSPNAVTTFTANVTYTTNASSSPDNVAVSGVGVSAPTASGISPTGFVW
jgi:hypothetical protein